ncbi:MAG: acyl-CoA dehydrogenase [Promethearchaeia archaeon]|nr:MAG: acyl-CoA dehydrogenase [Candidatus Lokiarchaeia archaeon]
MLLLNPHKLDRFYPDEISKQIMEKTVQWFENKGKINLLNDDFERVWYQDFLDFLKENKIFYKLLTPAKYGDGSTRWDTWRNCEFNEILAFYGLHYWYTWQVTILGLGPIFLSKNEKVKKETVSLLKEGGIFAFGLSEKEHGADIYSSDMILTKHGENNYTAKGSKYYIGNGNKASFVSVFGKSKPPFYPEDKKYGSYAFFVVKTDHEKYELVRNLVAVSSYVAEYRLNDYPITEDEILAKGREAWDMALNTVNIGKFNLGFASIGIATHAFYEAIIHASHRILYGKAVTEFPHIQSFFVEAYCRLVSMKLFALRAADYFRVATPEDRRYLLYNPMVKMWVTLQGEEVIDLLWDIIAAKGFEKTTYFSLATRDIRALPKLEGTVHVNMALVLKFMKNYFFNHAEFEEVPQVSEPKNDDFLFEQPPAKNLGKIRFHDYRKVYNMFNLPNVNRFKRNIKWLKLLLIVAPPTKAQSRDFDFLLNLGKLFTLVIYGQLILENTKYYKISDDLLEEIFDVLIRDFAKYALVLKSKPQCSWKQRWFCSRMLCRPKANRERFKRVWEKEVFTLKDLYEMNP